MSGHRTTAASLLRRPVTDVDGEHLGSVRDVRFVDRDGRLEATGLVVGRRMLSERLGYASGVVRGPALLTWWLSRRHSHLRWVPWDEVRSLDEDGVTLAVPAADLDPVLEARR